MTPPPPFREFVPVNKVPGVGSTAQEGSVKLSDRIAVRAAWGSRLRKVGFRHDFLVCL